MFALLKRVWILLVMAVVAGIGAAIVLHLHGLSAFHELERTGATTESNSKHVLYSVWGTDGAVVDINFLDEHAKPRRVVSVRLPWHYEIVTTDPAVRANVVAQGDTEAISCSIIVNGTVRDLRTIGGHRDQTFCTVRSG